jgi:hypothetical protein
MNAFYVALKGNRYKNLTMQRITVAVCPLKHTVADWGHLLDGIKRHRLLFQTIQTKVV